MEQHQNEIKLGKESVTVLEKLLSKRHLTQWELQRFLSLLAYIFCCLLSISFTLSSLFNFFWFILLLHLIVFSLGWRHIDRQVTHHVQCKDIVLSESRVNDHDRGEDHHLHRQNIDKHPQNLFLLKILSN